MLGFDSYSITLSGSILDQKIRLFSSRILLIALPIFLKYRNNSKANKEIEEISDLLFKQFILQIKKEGFYEEYLLISNLVLSPDYNFLIKDITSTIQDSEKALKEIFDKTLYKVFKTNKVEESVEEEKFSILLDPKTGLSSDQIISKVSTKLFVSLILKKYEDEIKINGIPDKEENVLLNNMLLKLINFDEET